MASGKIKNINEDKLSKDKRIVIDASKESDQRLNVGSGLYGQTGIHRVQPTFALRPDRKIIQSPDSAAVIILDNNPEYAKAGSDFCSRVAIIAGVNGSELTENEPLANYNSLKNAASLTVTQQGKSQKDLGLANPSTDDGSGVYEAFSDVTAYADVVQLVARNGGVNLYAGGVDTKLSNGIPNRESIGVNLIYGNRIEKDPKSPYSLQPLVKGNNLMKALNAANDRTAKLGSIVFQMQTELALLKATLAIHVHAVAGFGVGVALPSIELAVVAGLGAVKDVYNILSIMTERYNSFATKFNQSYATNETILSRWNKTN
tara:strand:- start:624 stop:1574 length:951 start_codon:yes stop_codon:yes gene_type:complete